MGIETVSLPKPASGSPRDMEAWAHQLVGALERHIASATPQGRRYDVTSPVEQRSLNATSGTLGDALAVLGTVISDLKKAGALS